MLAATSFVRRALGRLALGAALCALAGSAAAATPPAAQDEKEAIEAIQALVAKINRAWKEGDVAQMREVLSDKAFAFAMPRPGKPAEAAIMSKEGLCAGFERGMKENRPQKHEHRVVAVAVAGPLAFELGRTLHVTASGHAAEGEILNFFAKDEAGWQLFASADAQHLRKALRATDEDANTVRQMAQAYANSLRLGEPEPTKALESILADDVEMVWSDGRAGTGKATFLEWHKKGVEEIRSLFRSFEIRSDIQSVSLFPDCAIVFTKLELSGVVKEGGAAFRRDVWTTLVFTRAAAGWRLAREHSTRAAAAP